MPPTQQKRSTKHGPPSSRTSPFFVSAVALLHMRSVGQPPSAAGAPQVQFPGVPHTSGQIAVVVAATAVVHGAVEGRAKECQDSLRGGHAAGSAP